MKPEDLEHKILVLEGNNEQLKTQLDLEQKKSKLLNRLVKSHAEEKIIEYKLDELEDEEWKETQGFNL